VPKKNLKLVVGIIILLIVIIPISVHFMHTEGDLQQFSISIDKEISGYGNLDFPLHVVNNSPCNYRSIGGTGQVSIDGSTHYFTWSTSQSEDFYSKTTKKDAELLICMTNSNFHILPTNQWPIFKYIPFPNQQIKMEIEYGDYQSGDGWKRVGVMRGATITSGHN